MGSKPFGLFGEISLCVVLAACGSAGSAGQAASPPSLSGSPSSAPAVASASRQSSAAASAAEAASPAGQPSHLTVSYAALVATELPVWIANDAGIFKKNGLNLDVQYIESSKGIPALIAGQTQVAEQGGSETLSAVVGGADLVTVAVDSPVYFFVFQVPASIKTVADLKGKKVGVASIGSASDIATRVALRKVGLDPDKDVTILAVGSATNRIAAMQSGAIQGGLSFLPESLKLEAQGFHTLLDLAALGLPAAIATSDFQRSFVKAHREVVQKYVDSLIEATAKARGDKALAVKVLEKYYKSDDEHAMSLTYDYFLSKIIPALPYPKAEQYADSKAVLGEKNAAVRNFDVASMLDDSFVKDAANRGLDKP